MLEMLQILEELQDLGFITRYESSEDFTTHITTIDFVLINGIYYDDIQEALQKVSDLSRYDMDVLSNKEKTFLQNIQILLAN